MEISNRIQELMIYLKLSPTEFAENLNVQRSSISHLTSGRNKPSIDFIEKIINKYPEININWFISGKGVMLNKMNNEIINSNLLFPEFELEQKTEEKKVSEEIPVKKIEIKKEVEFTKKESINPNFLSEIPKNKEIKKIILIYVDNSFEVLQN